MQTGDGENSHTTKSAPGFFCLVFFFLFTAAKDGLILPFALRVSLKAGENGESLKS